MCHSSSSQETHSIDSLFPPSYKGEKEFAPPVTLKLGTTLPTHRQYDDPSQKSDGDFRIIGQNSRGAFPNGTTTAEFFELGTESFKQMEADAVLLSETNTDWKVCDNSWTAQLLNKAIWKPSPTKTTVASCVWENRDRSSFQTGGVLSVFLNSLPSRILKSVGDRLGRWTRTHVQLKNNNLVIYNVYRTHSKMLANAGIQTPWMMQWTALRRKGENDVDPRRQHMHDLTALIDEDASEGDMSLILGDFNEDVDDREKEGLELLENSPHVVNAFMHFNGQVPSSRANNRSIYHIYASRRILKYITKLGLCTEHDGFSNSDHVPFFIDVSAKLFSDNTNTIIPHQTRVLQMYDPIQVEKYVQTTLDRLKSQNIPGRIRALRKHIKTNGFDEEAITYLENIDSQVTKIRLSSEKSLLRKPTRFKSTAVATHQVQKIRLLETLRRKHRKGHCCQSTMDRLSTFEILYEINVDNIDRMITQERQELKQIQEDIDIHREDHLTKIQERSAADNNKALKTVIKEMKNREKQKRAWARIKFVTKRRSGGVTRLGIPLGYEDAPMEAVWNFLQDPKSQLEWVYITDPIQIENKLIQWQELHYNQAGDTPFASTYLHENMNPNNISEDDIMENLHHNTHMDGLHAASKEFFHKISESLLPQMNEQSVSITYAKYKSFYSKCPEKTSSSPSGLHMGHWKAAATDATLTSILVLIMDIAVTNSYSLIRWKKVIGVLLEKRRDHHISINFVRFT